MDHRFPGTRISIWLIVTVAACALAAPAVARNGDPKAPGPPEHSRGGEQKTDSPPGKGHGRKESRAPKKGGSKRAGIRAAGPAKPGRSNGAGRRGRHGRASKPASRSRGAEPGRTRHAAARGRSKVTICHATGSATNPYVRITVSESAVSAHRRHQHGEDVIGVGSGGCPSAAKPAASEKEQSKVTLCHATGSETNPFVVITVSVNALRAHDRHQHGEDVLGDGPCGGQKAVGADAVANPAPGPAVQSHSADGSPAAGAGVAGVSDESGGVRPVASSSPDGDAARDEDRASSPSLPFTGFSLAVLALVGGAALAGGARLRRAASRRD